MGPADLETELGGLASIHGDDVYSEWLYLLCRLHFTSDEAGKHWGAILEHQIHLGERLGETVDLRVALIHYFLEVSPQLESPIVIELNLFEAARETAYLDELTGLRNFRFFQQSLEHEMRRSDQTNQPLSLLMIDIDDFKIYNDRNGHQQGNRALAAIARVLETSVREIDSVARFGGEEFSVLLSATSKVGAREVAERLRQQIEGYPFTGREHQPGNKLTASFGVATYPADGRDADEFVRNADRALYVAKSRGKNLVEIYGDDRRSYRRLETALNGSFRSLGKDHSLTTVDLSTGGIKFRTECELAAGTLLEVRVELPDRKTDIPMAVRVVSVTPIDGGLFELAARTLEIDRRTLGILVGYLRELEPESPEADARKS